jgi:ribonuclease P protein component
MTLVRSEKLPARHRMTLGADFAALRAEGVAFRGALCLLVALRRPGEPTRIGFIASKRGVGDAVERNRARRRLREIVRRRFSRLPEEGWLLMFVAHRAAPTAPHQDLASDVERVLSAASVLAPVAIPDEGHPSLGGRGR